MGFRGSACGQHYFAWIQNFIHVAAHGMAGFEPANGIMSSN
jgi:hypothetical protein